MNKKGLVSLIVLSSIMIVGCGKGKEEDIDQVDDFDRVEDVEKESQN